MDACRADLEFRLARCQRPAVEADRLAAVRALIREAEEYEADAIIGLDFEVDSVNCTDIGGAPLQRVAATGIAAKFDQAA
jgi:uncharacterized protein YbjQ (UPF0145 family)